MGVQKLRLFKMMMQKATLLPDWGLSVIPYLFNVFHRVGCCIYLYQWQFYLMVCPSKEFCGLTFATYMFSGVLVWTEIFSETNYIARINIGILNHENFTFVYSVEDTLKLNIWFG